MDAGHVRRPRPGWAVENLPVLIQTVLEHRFSVEELPNNPVGWGMQPAVQWGATGLRKGRPRAEPDTEQPGWKQQPAMLRRLSRG